MTTSWPDALAAALGSPVSDTRGVGGGCISPAFRVTLQDGRRIFVKTVPAGAPAGLLACEAYSLRALAATGAVRVPDVLAEADDWLALEWLEPAAGGTGAWHELGRGLAALHTTTSASFGWDHDNFIGTLPQPNARTESWVEFWREQRLLPQLAQAAAQLGGSTMREFGELVDRLDELLHVDVAPSLLHGDLWGGNVHMSGGGGALIDPSSYYGHAEVDLAMARLFGGFPPAFFDAYDEARPPQPGAAARTTLYQLFYLLVHVNLFGGSYVDSTRRAVREVLR